jgi:hypothetical protein
VKLGEAPWARSIEPFDSEFICNGFAHGAKSGNILADAVTHTIDIPLELIVLLGAVNQLE